MSEREFNPEQLDGLIKPNVHLEDHETYGAITWSTTMDALSTYVALGPVIAAAQQSGDAPVLTVVNMDDEFDPQHLENHHPTFKLGVDTTFDITRLTNCSFFQLDLPNSYFSWFKTCKLFLDGQPAIGYVYLNDEEVPSEDLEFMRVTSTSNPAGDAAKKHNSALTERLIARVGESLHDRDKRIRERKDRHYETTIRRRRIAASVGSRSLRYTTH